jgi:hypothetical protein
MNNFNNSKPTRLSKVYFTWVIRDFGTAEWFHSLLHAIEEQDTQNRIEINIYLTGKIKEDDMNNIIVSLFFVVGSRCSVLICSSDRSRTLEQRRMQLPLCVLPPTLAGPIGIVYLVLL